MFFILLGYGLPPDSKIRAERIYPRYFVNHSALAASGESHPGSASLVLESLQELELIELADTHNWFALSFPIMTT